MKRKNNGLPEEFENLKNECAPILTRYGERIEQFHNDFVGLTTVEYAGQPETPLRLRELDSGKFDDFFYDLSEININKEPLKNLFCFKTNKKNSKIIEKELVALSPFNLSSPMFSDLRITGDVKINEALSDIYSVKSQPVIFRNCVFQDTFDIISKDEPINLNASFRFENVTFKGDVSLENIDGKEHNIVFDRCTFDGEITFQKLNDISVEIVNSKLSNEPKRIDSKFIYLKCDLSQVKAKTKQASKITDEKMLGVLGDEITESTAFELDTRPEMLEFKTELIRRINEFEKNQEDFRELADGYAQIIKKFQSYLESKTKISADVINNFFMSLKEYILTYDPKEQLKDRILTALSNTKWRDDNLVKLGYRSMKEYANFIQLPKGGDFGIESDSADPIGILLYNDINFRNLEITEGLSLSDELSYLYLSSISFSDSKIEGEIYIGLSQPKELLISGIGFYNVTFSGYESPVIQNIIGSLLLMNDLSFYDCKFDIVTGDEVFIKNVHNYNIKFSSNMSVSNYGDMTLYQNNISLVIKNSTINKLWLLHHEKETKPIIYNIDCQNCIINEEVDFVYSIANPPLYGKVNFSEVEFNDKVKFSNIKIKEQAIFTNCVFDKEIDFVKASFQQGADFSGSTFKGETNFNNAKFKNTTKFTEFTKDVDGKEIEQKCIFYIPPKFHNAKLHKDTSFHGSYFGYCLDSLKKSYNNATANEYARAFMTLRQHMSNTSNDIEATRFFKHEQKMHRIIYQHNVLNLKLLITKPLQWFSNLLNWFISTMYRLISDYGESTSWPILWLLGIWVLFGYLFSDNMVVINSGLSVSNVWTTQIGTNHPIILGFAYSTQSIIDPLSLFNTDVTLYPKTLFAAILAKIEAISGITIITLWIFAVRRRFQKGE